MAFPNEIILSVLEPLSKGDLKSIRLVSRSWSKCASVYLFDHVYISVNKEDLDVFKAVTEHDELKHYVRTLVYDASHFIPNISKRSYVEDLHRQKRCLPYDSCSTYEPGNSGNSPDPDVHEWIRHRHQDHTTYTKFKNRAFINHGYRKYKEHAASQQLLLLTADFEAIFTGGLKALDTLQSVTMSRRWQLLSSPKERRTGSPLMRSWDNFHCLPTGWTWNLDGSYLGGNGAFHYKLLVRALVHAQRRIQSCDIERYSYPGLPAMLFSGNTMGSPRLDITAFAQLRSLSLNLGGVQAGTTHRPFQAGTTSGPFRISFGFATSCASLKHSS